MSMTKDLFFDALADAMQPTDAEIEMQYWYELKERREMYLAFVTKQIEEMPESHFFSADFEAWMQQQKAERSKNHAETLLERRKVSTPTTDMDFDIPMDVEDANHQKRNQELDNLFF